MKRFETELNNLREQLLEMWSLVSRQLERSAEACLVHNKDLAHEVVDVEKMVDTYELKIDQQCEELLALQTPVAIDLRFVLASLKINTNLERIGDLAKGIARASLQLEKGKFDLALLKAAKVEVMFEVSVKMLKTVHKAYRSGDSAAVRTVYADDKVLDDITHHSIPALTGPIEKKPSLAGQALILSEIIRKLERVGDHCCNIADEIAFHIEAKVLKHQKKKEEK